MQAKHVFLTIGPLLVATLVASALAQGDPRPRDSGSADRLRDYVAPSQRNANADLATPNETPPPRTGSNSLLPSYNAYYPLGSLMPGADPTRAPLMAEEASLSQQAATLIGQFNAADSNSEKDDLKSKLGETLGKQFDLRQKRHQQEIDALEAQVKKLKELVQRRQDNRAEIISRKLDQIIRDSQGLGF